MSTEIIVLTSTITQLVHSNSQMTLNVQQDSNVHTLETLNSGITTGIAAPSQIELEDI